VDAEDGETTGVDAVDDGEITGVEILEETDVTDGQNSVEQEMEAK
jgi:uncharacterized protein YuzE